MARKTDSESITQLAAQRDQLKAEVEKLSALSDNAHDRFEAARPEKPEEIFVKGLEDQVMLDGAWFRPPTQYALRNKIRQSVPAEGWRSMLANPPRSAGSGEICERIVERIRAGLAAAERYEELLRTVDLETGYSAANDAWEAALDRLLELDKRILAERAQSVEDLARQAEVIRARDGGDASGEMIEALLASIEALNTQAVA